MAFDRYSKLRNLDAQGKIDFKDFADVPQASLEAKSILITGGASGLGQACARMFAAAGAYVVIADRDHDQGQALVTELGARVKFIEVDVSSYHSQLLLFASALQFFPNQRLDTLITFAGVKSQDWSLSPYSDGAQRLSEYAQAYSKGIASIDPPSTQCVDVALYGSLYSVHIAVKYGFGLDSSATSSHPSQTTELSRSVILVSSTAGYRHLENKPDYTMAKFGVRGIMRCLRSSLPHITESAGIRINLLAPFFIPTPMTAPLIPALDKAGIRLGRMEDVTKAVAIMATDIHMNGRAVSVTAEGLRDLCDDTAGEEGGEEINALLQEGWLSCGASATIR